MRHVQKSPLDLVGWPRIAVFKDVAVMLALVTVKEVAAMLALSSSRLASPVVVADHARKGHGQRKRCWHCQRAVQTSEAGQWSSLHLARQLELLWAH